MVRLDLRNLIIPFCLLKASNAFLALDKDDVLEILCDDSENINALLRIIPAGSCKILPIAEMDRPASGLMIRLKKTTQ